MTCKLSEMGKAACWCDDCVRAVFKSSYREPPEKRAVNPCDLRTWGTSKVNDASWRVQGGDWERFPAFSEPATPRRTYEHNARPETTTPNYHRGEQ